MCYSGQPAGLYALRFVLSASAYVSRFELVAVAATVDGVVRCTSVCCSVPLWFSFAAGSETAVAHKSFGSFDVAISIVDVRDL